MANLFDIREDIKYRILFDRKLKEHPEVVQFFFTLKNWIDLNKRYETPAQPEVRAGGRMAIFRNMLIKPRKPSLKEKFSTLDDYLKKGVFYTNELTAESIIKGGYTYNLIARPDRNHCCLSEIDECLTHWTQTKALYDTIRHRILENKGVNLNLVKDEPSILTIRQLLTPEEYSFVSDTGKDELEFPFVSLLPIFNFCKFHKREAKECLIALCIGLVATLLGIGGIYLNKQPYTWMGAAVVGIAIALIAGGLFYNILSLFLKGDNEKHEKWEWVYGWFGLITGAVFFFCSYSVVPEYSTPSSFYNSSSGYEESIDNTTVYVTEYGECYHSTPNCPSLYRSRNIYSASKSRASRTHRRCSKCY